MMSWPFSPILSFPPQPYEDGTLYLVLTFCASKAPPGSLNHQPYSSSPPPFTSKEKISMGYSHVFYHLQVVTMEKWERAGKMEMLGTDHGECWWMFFYFYFCRNLGVQFLLYPAKSSNQTLPGIIKLFSARESFVSDIPTGDGKIANLFLQCSFPSSKLSDLSQLTCRTSHCLIIKTLLLDYAAVR